ncbi:MAG: mannose-1-phosphate guanylyltransferase [Bacteroidales bacterium]|nr:mannose-1-phosphate guanylyltransferase [Bacteroidales bacterium]MBN2756177.1 mannose-1-phosphate guanylyltransferase [Bacteroidales bacterium]
MDNNNYCVIMAGGIGSRFWPLSRYEKPKQFLDILGTGKTLLQQTFSRMIHICPVQNVFIVSNEDYLDLIISQLPNVKPENILLEPMRRNTAPCVAYANYKIQQLNPNANIVVAPSDHLILDEIEFVKVIKKSLEFTKSNDVLLTLGIKPNRPETGYGYIQISNSDKSKGQFDFTKVKTFTEKPDIEMAKIFFESGEFYWNSGIFIWSLNSILKSFNNYLPEVNDLFKKGIKNYNTDNERDFINETYSACKNISIDYGIIEKADNVYVLCADFGWSDLGTWGSLFENSKKDKNNNSVVGNNIFVYDSKNSIINLPNIKLAVIQGLNDYIIVESEGILLICKKEDEQKIRQFVNDVKLKNGDTYI